MLTASFLLRPVYTWINVVVIQLTNDRSD